MARNSNTRPRWNCSGDGYEWWHDKKKILPMFKGLRVSRHGVMIWYKTKIKKNGLWTLHFVHSLLSTDNSAVEFSHLFFHFLKSCCLLVIPPTLCWNCLLQETLFPLLVQRHWGNKVWWWTCRESKSFSFLGLQYKRIFTVEISETGR